MIWHDLECGCYAADLELWEELAGAAPGPALDLGCGTGRVAIALASKAHVISGLDLDPKLVGAFNDRAGGLPAEAEVGHAADFDLGTEFGLVLAPMQLAQLLAGSEERARCLRSVSRHLAPGGRVALAIVESLPDPIEAPPPLPDTREIDGWVYSSLPLPPRVTADELLVGRLRQTVSPSGDFSEEIDEVRLCTLSAHALEREGRSAGLRPAGRRAIEATADHVGSTVVVFTGGA